MYKLTQRDAHISNASVDNIQTILPILFCQYMEVNHGYYGVLGMLA